MALRQARGRGGRAQAAHRAGLRSPSFWGAGRHQAWGFSRGGQGRLDVVSGGVSSLRQKIFKGKIIFLVCCFR